MIVNVFDCTTYVLYVALIFVVVAFVIVTGIVVVPAVSVADVEEIVPVSFSCQVQFIGPATTGDDGELDGSFT